ncbi:MAG TPA: hypothetical protein GXX26_00605 [Clostridiaceae bacterium]|nr:hypothetical protein [Clostridiaceae bacterium]
MSCKEHKAYKEEHDHLIYTLDLVKENLDAFRQNKEKIDAEIDRLLKFGSSDSSLDYTDLSVYKILQGSYALKIKNLIEAIKKPYFARIDFHEEDRNEPDSLYIGKMCLIRGEDMKPVIIDWRAPVASLYYEERYFSHWSKATGQR